jgi:hypothetical protein
MITAGHEVPNNIDFGAQELLEAPEGDRPACSKNIAEALTRRLLKDETSHWSEGGVGAGYGVCKGDSS